MAKNKIITSQGNVQFINSKGKVINMHPMHCYYVVENDTISFLFIYMKEYSGQAFFASQFEDLEVNGELYDNMDDLIEAITEAFAKAGAQARTEIVDELPETGFTNTIYLVPKEHGSGYDEYVYTEEGEWELIGDTDIEFDRYLEKTVFYEYSAATDGKIDYISGAVDTNASDIEYISGAVDTEISAREAADAFISGAVDTVSADLASEVSRALAAEASLGNRIDTVNSRVDAEQLARVQADTALSGAIETEISDRESADTALQNAIDAEASARTDADTALEGKIDAVSGAVDTEVARATSAETLLNTAINTETSARRNADDAILGKVDVVSGAVDTEVARAEAAEAAIDAKVDTLSGEVQTLGDDKAEKTEAVASAVYVSSSTTIDLMNISGEVISQVDATDFVVDGMVDEVKIENGYLVIVWNTDAGKQETRIPLTDIFDPDNYYDKTAVDGFISDLEATDSVISGAVENVSADLATEAQRAQDAEDALSGAIDTKLAISDFNTYSGAVETELDSKANSADVYTKSEVYTKAEVDEAIDEIDLSDYYTKTETDGLLDTKADLSALTEDERVWGEALNDLNTRINTVSGDVASKQDTLSAGRGIDITNDVVSLDFPISAGTGADSLLMSGSGNTASGKYSVAFGKLNTVSGECGVIMGNRNTSNNFAETAFGQKNVSRTEAASSFGSSGNTIFTVGNGIINVEQGVDANHNAFEIRGNGDIYIADTNAAGSYYEKPMIKLQDHLGGGEVSSAITSGDTNAVAGGAVYDKFDEVEQVTAAALNNINDRLSEDEEVTAAALNNINDRLSEDEEVTAAGLNAVNSALGGLKLQQITQSAYDALTTKDASTLYIIVN